MSERDHDGRPIGREASSDELRAQVELTRERFGRDIDQVRARLSPRGLEHEATAALRGAGGVAGEAIEEWSHAVDRGAGRLGGLVVMLVKRYPVATTLVGVGLAWLLLRSGAGERHTALPAVPRERRPELEPPIHQALRGDHGPR